MLFQGDYVEPRPNVNNNLDVPSIQPYFNEGLEIVAKQTEIHTKTKTQHAKCNQEIFFKQKMKKKSQEVVTYIEFLLYEKQNTKILDCRQSSTMFRIELQLGL